MLGLTWGAAGPETARRWQTLHILLGRPAATSWDLKRGWSKLRKEKEGLPTAGTTFTAGQGQFGSTSESRGISHWLSKGPLGQGKFTGARLWAGREQQSGAEAPGSRAEGFDHTRQPEAASGS